MIFKLIAIGLIVILLSSCAAKQTGPTITRVPKEQLTVKSKLTEEPIPLISAYQHNLFSFNVDDSNIVLDHLPSNTRVFISKNELLESIIDASFEMSTFYDYYEKSKQDPYDLLVIDLFVEVNLIRSSPGTEGQPREIVLTFYDLRNRKQVKEIRESIYIDYNSYSSTYDFRLAVSDEFKNKVISLAEDIISDRTYFVEETAKSYINYCPNQVVKLRSDFNELKQNRSGSCSDLRKFSRIFNQIASTGWRCEKFVSNLVDSHKMYNLKVKADELIETRCQ